MEESNKSVNIEKNEEEARFSSEERLACSDRLEDEEVSVTTTVHTDKDTIKNNSSTPESEALTLPVPSRAKSSSFFITDILSSDKTRVSLPRGDNVLCSDENPHHRLDMYSRVGHSPFNAESFDELVKRKYGIKRSYDETDLVSEPASPVSQSERKIFSL